METKKLNLNQLQKIEGGRPKQYCADLAWACFDAYVSGDYGMGAYYYSWLVYLNCGQY